MVFATGAFPSPFITTRNLRFGPLNRLTHHLLTRLIWSSAQVPARMLRAELGLAPPTEGFGAQVARHRVPSMLAYDEALVPRPADWGDHVEVTGHWAMPRALRERLGEAAPDAALEAFLAAGEPPIFLGFGSMPVLDSARMLATVREALAKAGGRAVLAAGWSTVEAASDEQLHVIDTADHDALLPRCAGAIHHGGAGTTAASLRAGVPTWICSVFADQPFWGARCQALGVGGTFPFVKLDADRLAGAIRTLRDPGVRERAARLGERLRAEDGLGRAVTFLETRAAAVPVPR